MTLASESAYPFASQFAGETYGLTKREHFAVTVLAGICAKDSTGVNTADFRDCNATWAVQQADALIDALDSNEDICGFCGKPGADKVPHPIRWPGEETAGTEYVHAECEDEECGRANSLLSDKERERFIRWC